MLGFINKKRVFRITPVFLLILCLALLSCEVAGDAESNIGGGGSGNRLWDSLENTQWVWLYDGDESDIMIGFYREDAGPLANKVSSGYFCHFYNKGGWVDQDTYDPDMKTNRVDFVNHPLYIIGKTISTSVPGSDTSPTDTWYFDGSPIYNYFSFDIVVNGNELRISNWKGTQRGDFYNLEEIEQQGSSVSNGAFFGTYTKVEGNWDNGHWEPNE